MGPLFQERRSTVRTITGRLCCMAHTDYDFLAFRPDDKGSADAVNAELQKWLASEEHLKTVEPFGLVHSTVTEKTVAEPCTKS